MIASFGYDSMRLAKDASTQLEIRERLTLALRDLGLIDEYSCGRFELVVNDGGVSRVSMQQFLA